MKNKETTKEKQNLIDRSSEILEEALEMAHGLGFGIVRVFGDGEIVCTQENIFYENLGSDTYIDIQTWNVEDYFQMTENEIVKEFGSEEEAIKEAIWDMRIDTVHGYYNDLLENFVRAIKSYPTES